MPETSTPREEPAHDVLAAELFGMPAPDPELHHGPVHPPEDPAGIAEPHDVLAAEEFPMPAARPGPRSSLIAKPESPQHRMLLAAGLLAFVWLLRRRRRPRSAAS